MFIYQKGNYVNIVKGSKPEEIPGVSVGFDTAGEVEIFVNGAIVSADMPTEKFAMATTSFLDGKEISIEQPNAKLIYTDTGYELTGTLVKTPEQAKAWGYADPENVALYAVTIVFDGYTDAEHFRGKSYGVSGGKDISPAKFDGPNYITYVMNAVAKKDPYWEYTTTYSGDGEPTFDHRITLNISATIEGEE